MNVKEMLTIGTFFLCVSCTSNIDLGTPVEQVTINRIDSMPDIPVTYQMLDWKKKARDFDKFVFDWENTSKVGPLIWLDNARRNIDQPTFGLYTAVKDIRQGKNVNN